MTRLVVCRGVSKSTVNTYGTRRNYSKKGQKKRGGMKVTVLLLLLVDISMYFDLHQIIVIFTLRDCCLSQSTNPILAVL
jgi:hypothetical protein